QKYFNRYFERHGPVACVRDDCVLAQTSRTLTRETGTITQLVCVRQEQRAGKGSIDAGYVGKFRQGRILQIFVYYLEMGDGSSNERARSKCGMRKVKTPADRTPTRFTASFGCSGQTAAALEAKATRAAPQNGNSKRSTCLLRDLMAGSAA